MVKRFTLGEYNDKVQEVYDDGEFIGVVGLNNAKEIVELLNEQHETIQQLQSANMEMEDYLARLEEENEQLKHNNKMLSMKMSEVSTKYKLLKEFSEDTNPNDAVKTVLHELMMITKEYR